MPALSDSQCNCSCNMQFVPLYKGCAYLCFRMTHILSHHHLRVCISPLLYLLPHIDECVYRNKAEACTYVLRSLLLQEFKSLIVMFIVIVKHFI